MKSNREESGRRHLSFFYFSLLLPNVLKPSGEKFIQTFNIFHVNFTRSSSQGETLVEEQRRSQIIFHDSLIQKVVLGVMLMKSFPVSDENMHLTKSTWY